MSLAASPGLPVWELVFGVKHLAQDLNLPLAYSQLEHLIGEDRRIDDRGARSDLKLAFRRSIDGQSAVVADQERLGSLRTARGQFPPVAKNAHRKNVSSATTRRRGFMSAWCEPYGRRVRLMPGLHLERSDGQRGRGSAC